MNLFKLIEGLVAQWFERHKKAKPLPRRWRQYRHHAGKTDYMPAPRKGWHYEKGQLVRNRAAA